MTVIKNKIPATFKWYGDYIVSYHFLDKERQINFISFENWEQLKKNKIINSVFYEEIEPGKFVPLFFDKDNKKLELNYFFTQYEYNEAKDDWDQWKEKWVNKQYGN